MAKITRSQPPAANLDVSVTATFAAPAALDVTSLDVQHGAVGRSYVRYVDLGFNQSAGLQNLIDTGGITLTKYDLNGANPVSVSLTGVLSVVGTKISFDFGSAGIGGNANTTAGDGYYEIRVRGATQIANFYRLLGDVNGDRVVNNADLAAISAAINQTGDGLDADVNGDRAVTTADSTLAKKSLNRVLTASLKLGLRPALLP